MTDYREKAVQCVKDTVLPLQRKMFQECGCDLDAQYQKYGTSDGFFANIIQPGRIYEMGYPKCVCPEVRVLPAEHRLYSGKPPAGPEHCRRNHGNRFDRSGPLPVSCNGRIEPVRRVCPRGRALRKFSRQVVARSTKICYTISTISQHRGDDYAKA